MRHSKILIIEDSPLDREVYKRCLWQSDWGFEFAEAESAAIGIEMARAWGPDCALFDVNLPDMDGIEALSRLKGSSGRAPCAAVVLTAFGGEAVAVRAMKAGAMDYLPKGQVTAGTFPHIVVNAIERFQMQERIEEQRCALERSGRSYQVLLEAIPQMVWTTNAEGCIEYANRRWLEYTDLTLENAGRFGWDRLLHPADRERTWIAWNQVAASGSVFEIEHRLRRASDGSYRWHLVRAVPIRGQDGAVTNWFGTCTDIENQKQSNTATSERQKFESIGRLAGGVAHDFNNLLVTVLCGASYAMEDLPDSHPARETLQAIIQAGEQAAELTRKMLAYAGKGNLCVARISFNELIRDAIAAVAIPKEIRLEFHGANHLPPLETDPEQLRQAVVDLLRNAVEAIGDGASGAIRVHTSVVDLDPESALRDFASSGIGAGKYVVLDVMDTGCGIGEDAQKMIFDPFFSTKFAGRGLGLAAVHGFLRSNGGDVRVDSAPGKGARFRALLPAALEKKIPGAPEPEFRPC